MRKSHLTGLIPALLLAVAQPASAHMAWIERPSPETVNVYFGEPDDREKTGGALDRLVPTISTNDAASLKITREADHIAATVAPGDSEIRLVDERYPHFGEGARGVMRPMIYARHGRTGTQARMAFEFVPVAPGGDRFSLVLQGKALAHHKVTIIAPGYAESEGETDEAGVIALTVPVAGQYLLKASDIDRTPGSFDGKPFDMTARVTTLTFIQK